MVNNNGNLIALLTLYTVDDLTDDYGKIRSLKSLASFPDFNIIAIV